VRLVSPMRGDTGGSGNLSTSLSNVARLRHIQNLCGFSTPTAIGQSFIMTLCNSILLYEFNKTLYYHMSVFTARRA
jgi:hypothetical protein